MNRARQIAAQAISQTDYVSCFELHLLQDLFRLQSRLLLEVAEAQFFAQLICQMQQADQVGRCGCHGMMRAHGVDEPFADTGFHHQQPAEQFVVSYVSCGPFSLAKGAVLGVHMGDEIPEEESQDQFAHIV